MISKKRLVMFFFVSLLSLVLVGIVLAADNPPQKENPPANAADVATPTEGKAENSTYHSDPNAAWPGPDGFGYMGSAVSYNWVEISGSGTAVYLLDDDYDGPFPIGFNFYFYGTAQSEFFINSNGYISFGSGYTTLSNQCPLPNSTAPDNIIPLMWDDLDPGDTSDPVYFQSFSTCPVGTGECLVVQYEDFCHYPGGVDCSIAGTWEAILYSDGKILLQYEDAGIEEGSGSTTGIEDTNAAGDWGLTYACDTPASITDALAILFIPPSAAPRYDDSTKYAPAEVLSGDTIEYTIIITNTGNAPGLNTTMTDPIPLGTVYNDDVTCSSGTCWYDGGVVYWAGEVGQPPLAQNTTPEAVKVSTPQDAPNAFDLVGALEPAAPGVPVTVAAPEDILYDNGPMVTFPGGCAGMDASRLQTGLTMNTLGFGHQYLVGNRMADDFIITDPGGWNIENFQFFAYQTNAPSNPSPITGVYYQIWDGPPDNPASNIIFGDLVTNRLVSSTFSNIQRDSDTTPCANNRYIFEDTASAGLYLPPGTYWLDWMTDGSLSSGPWAPPITIIGQTTTGNALQYIASTSAWGPANDSGTLTQQGMPFRILGTSAGYENPVVVTFSVTPVDLTCGMVYVNEATITDPDALNPVTVSASTELVNPAYYAEDFEADDGGYANMGTNLFTWGPPPQNPSAHSGINAWATDMPYVASSWYELWSPWIDLSAANPINDLVITWWQDLYIESSSYDHAYLEITTDEINWTIVWQHTGGTYQSEGWEKKTADITPYIGENVRLRFRFTSDSSVQYDGWAIDDISIRSGCQLFLYPEIDVTPAELSATLAPDQTTVQELNICNLGDAPLTWDLKEIEAVPPRGVQDVLWDNGPLITHPGGGYNGADASALQTALGMNTYGFGHQFTLGYWVADDFEITDPAGWDLESITFFAYQTGSGTTPSITGVYYQILDGPPDAGGNVVCGDTVTNRLNTTVWNNLYRVLDTSLLNVDRPTMDDTVSIAPGCEFLPQGTYWIMWSTDGTLASGPWAPPVSIIGQTTTGNAKQSLDNGSTWADLTDTGTLTPQGLPFIIQGVIAGPPFDAPWLSEDPLSGVVDAGLCQVVDVTFDSTGLADGDYFAGLKIHSDDADEPNIIVPVQLTVVTAPDIVVTAPPLEWNLYPNESHTLTFAIGNTGFVPLTWSIAENPLAAWLTVVPASGSINPGGVVPVDVTFDSTGLDAGTYTTKLVITSNDPDESPLELDVTLIVENHAFYLPFLHK